MKLHIIIVVCSLLAGAAFGYLAAHLVYVPKLDRLTTRVTALESEVSSLGQTISEQEAEISAQQTKVSTQEATISEQKARISTLELESTNLQADLSQAQAQAQSYREQMTTQQSQLSALEERLDKVLAITVTQHYTWEYQWRTWYWDLPIELSAYVEYWESPRPVEHLSWVDMARDPNDDFYINDMVQGLNEFALERHFTDAQRLNFVVTFVQSMPYTVDSVTTPYDEYPRYPLETLFSRGGDCEDTSILVAALLDAMGYDVALLVLEDAQHMAVGVAIPGSFGTYYQYYGKQYFYLETTGEGWQIGDFPPSITDTIAYIYPLRS